MKQPLDLNPDASLPGTASRRLAGGFALLLLLTYGLIILGALVRAHGAGLACPDWPLCFGRFIPELDVKVAFEWGHRLAAGFISVLFVLLGAAVLRDPIARQTVGRILAVSAVLLGVQVILGALTVWKLLASWSVTSHLLTGNAFAVSLLFATLRLHEVVAPPPLRRSLSRAALTLVTATLGLLVVQIALGGLVSSQYAGLACPEWPACFEGAWFPTLQGPRGLHVLHRTAGYALVALVALGAWTTRRVPVVGRLYAAAVVLAVAQVAVGVANVLLRIPVEITGLHSALAAALVLTLSGAAREAWRRA